MSKNNQRPLVDGVPVCYRGHPIVGWNAKPVYGAYVTCRECQNAATRENYERKRLRAQAEMAKGGAHEQMSALPKAGED